MTVEFKDLIELVTGIAWPVVVAVVLAVFYKPLARFVEELGKRATKLSLFEVVSIEIATVPSPPAPWEDPTMGKRQQRYTRTHRILTKRLY